ncbi:MAG: hypothetical protein RMY16_25560 [Nostoc sp. DedQUE12b]|uniref:hypothetical protein n=1 Tax=unclassified Nostoc TaxID=2593658 RepID=UPI002AD3A431|nr:MULTISPECIES: hypothetical protein [unclassified Nostoc]MDZ7955924.1 hypothetical protein [Nostoc sp. DedQUE09]MDZ8088886.1 hypothetical protein [Nostoc sp. DedQUE12b]
MLKTTSKTGKDSFSITFSDLDNNFLSELSYDEASEITGGFQVNNDSGSTKAFYTFGQFVQPQRQLLQPGQSGDYDGEYILYSSSRTSFEPTISQKLAPTDIVSFRLLGDTVVIGSGNVFFSVTQV